MTDSLPLTLRLDPSTRRGADGRSLVGGTPLRVLRLSARGAARLDALLTGEPVPATGATHRLARHLLDAGIVQPVPGPARLSPADVTVVIPVRDDAAGLDEVLRDVAGSGVAAVVVVDDGSDGAAGIAAVAARHGAQLRTHVLNAGPGNARNTGLAAVTTALVAFVDADVTLPAGWLAPLLAHLNDPAVVLVAPRVVAGGTGSSVLADYERARSPLDLGSVPSRVGPTCRVAYVPAATVLCRTAELRAVGGFEPSLRVGEDVDLAWRLTAAGHSVRYEPAAMVDHRTRPTWAALWRQRRTYGTSAAALARRHPGAVAPVRLNRWTFLTWSLLALGGRWGRRAGLLVGAGSAAALAPRLRGRVDQPAREALRLAGRGNLWAGLWLADALRRAWLPGALVLAVSSRRARRAAGVALGLAPLVEWVRDRPPLDPARYLALRLADDAAYCLGVWEGCWAERSAAALLPQVQGLDTLLPTARGDRPGQ
jgi:mycofactocin system glycosyltransferase